MLTGSIIEPCELLKRNDLDFRCMKFGWSCLQMCGKISSNVIEVHLCRLSCECVFHVMVNTSNFFFATVKSQVVSHQGSYITSNGRF